MTMRQLSSKSPIFTMAIFGVFTLGALGAFGASSSFAADDLCNDALLSAQQVLASWEAAPVPAVMIQPDFIATNRANAVATYNLYKELASGAKSGIRARFDDHSVARILTDESSSGYILRLKALLEAYQQSDESFSTVLGKFLEGKVPARTIDSRVHNAIPGNMPGLHRALGEMELVEVQELTHGGDPLHPTPDSLLGKYIAETGAQTVIRTFSQTVAENGPQGTEKLVVAMSANSFATHQKYFGNQNFLIHTHGPQQGTLYVAFDNKTYSWAGDRGDLRFSQVGSLWPHILLKTTEVERTRNYFALHSKNVGLAMRPWDSLQNYCARGAYNSCTHWIANLPIGDKKVDEYRYPGFVDNYAANHLPDYVQDPAKDAAPRVKALEPHGNPDPLVQMVYQAPGHEQLAGVLSLMPQQEAAEFANPGYVLLTLTSRTETDRVPFVFVITNDHQEPLTADFNRIVHPY
jgi:hypothetical protein